MGDLDACNLAAAKLGRMESELRGAVHTSDHTQRCLRTSYQSWSASWIDAQYLPGFSYDETFSKGGSVFAEAAAEYDFERMHVQLNQLGGMDLVLGWPGWLVAPLMHWGNVSAVQEAADKMVPCALRCQAEFKGTDWIELLYFKSAWPFYLCKSKRKTLPFVFC